MANVRLMRTWYKTDVTEDDPTYKGSFSAPFPAQMAAKIVHVDWSVRGEVEVTYVIPAP